MMIFTRNTARRGTLAISILTCFDMRSQIAWQAWYFVHIGYLQDASIIALRVLNVWQAWYFGDLHAHLYRYAIANCVAGVVLRVHSLLSR